MANSSADRMFTHDLTLADDGAVSFACSQDQDEWPWLALHPHHPIALQNIQYWVSVETGRARGTFDGTKWTAITWTRWECGDANAGNPVRGISEILTEGGKIQSQLTFYDCHDAVVSVMRFKGVEFRTRDFEAWREKAKQSSGKTVSLSAFDFAAAKAVGSENIGPSFLSSLGNGPPPYARGLMAMDNAFPPAHPTMSGSGDHVNSTHLAEAAHQFFHLLEDGKPLRIARGEMWFTHYVELGRPFRIELTGRDGTSASAMVTQGGHDCTRITMELAAA